MNTFVALAGLLVLGFATTTTNAALINTSIEVEGCNSNDVSARAVVEQYLGDGVPDFSLYQTTKTARATVVASLTDNLLMYVSCLASCFVLSRRVVTCTLSI